jgi:hypothetical protein
MRFGYVITFRTKRSQGVSIWKGEGHGLDHITFANDMIAVLRRRQKRRLEIIGVLVHKRDAEASRPDAPTTFRP